MPAGQNLIFKIHPISSFRIGREKGKVLDLLASNPGEPGYKIIRWSEWQARRIYESKILPSLGIDKKAPQYAGEQDIREMDETGKIVEIKLKFAGYDVPNYSQCILAITHRQTTGGAEIQSIELRKFTPTSFPTHLQNLRQV